MAKFYVVVTRMYETFEKATVVVEADSPRAAFAIAMKRECIVGLNANRGPDDTGWVSIEDNSSDYNWKVYANHPATEEPGKPLLVRTKTPDSNDGEGS